jgi:hypothetical protein
MRFYHALSVYLFLAVYNCHVSAHTGIFFNPGKIRDGVGPKIGKSIRFSLRPRAITQFMYS